MSFRSRSSLFTKFVVSGEMRSDSKLLHHLMSPQRDHDPQRRSQSAEVCRVGGVCSGLVILHVAAGQIESHETVIPALLISSSFSLHFSVFLQLDASLTLIFILPRVSGPSVRPRPRTCCRYLKHFIWERSSCLMTFVFRRFHYNDSSLDFLSVMSYDDPNMSDFQDTSGEVLCLKFACKNHVTICTICRH